MIKVQCPKCGKVHRATEAVAGRKVQCKDCGAIFVVNSDVPEATQQPDAGEIDQLAAAGAAGRPSGPIPDEPTGVHAQLPATGPKRPFGVVWVVFYWIISGVAGLVGGYILFAMGGALGGVIGGAKDMFDSGEFSKIARAGSLAMAALEFLGLLLFHYGLLLMVACYGLWTYRRWGLSLARGLAVASVVLNGIALIITLVTRAGIVVSLVGTVISAGILVYLYGSANLRDRLRRYLRTGPSQGNEWGMVK